MSVYTIVSEDQVSAWLKNYAIGHLKKLEGISSGIENTNYFLTTTHGEYVLTLFEKLSLDQLPYYIKLMSHLSHRGIPCPLPMERTDGECLGLLNDKPACIVTKLSGKATVIPTAQHCAEVGTMLAKMHLAAADYPLQIKNCFDLPWCKIFGAQVAPLLPKDEAALLENELAFQSSRDNLSLPRGVIHGDLFRDNVLFEDSRISGLIDFYFSCNESLIFDIAITVNDWCGKSDATLDETLAYSLVSAYNKVRPLTDNEKRAWTFILRAAAFRSWLGRLGYVYFPQPGEITHTKDDGYFRQLLEHYKCHSSQLYI